MSLGLVVALSEAVHHRGGRLRVDDARQVEGLHRVAGVLALLFGIDQALVVRRPAGEVGALPGLGVALEQLLGLGLFGIVGRREILDELPGVLVVGLGLLRIQRVVLLVVVVQHAHLAVGQRHRDQAVVLVGRRRRLGVVLAERDIGPGGQQLQVLRGSLALLQPAVGLSGRLTGQQLLAHALQVVPAGQTLTDGPGPLGDELGAGVGQLGTQAAEIRTGPGLVQLGALGDQRIQPADLFLTGLRQGLLLVGEEGLGRIGGAIQRTALGIEKIVQREFSHYLLPAPFKAS